VEGSLQSEGSNPAPAEHLIRAPEQLGLETRIEFRKAASSLVDRIPTGAGRLVVDCASLNSIDSSGLNSLILVRRRAVGRRVEVVLRELNEELLSLLVLTKLDDLFVFEDGQTR
jgi:anti-anti-sigma factor